MNSQNEHPDKLLPWYVNGTLGADERRQVESHIGQCDRCQQEVAWLRSLRKHIKADGIQDPGELGLQRLLREVRVEKPTSRQWWRPAMAAAMAIIVIQFAVIINAHRPPSGIVPLSGPELAGVVVQIKFAPSATEAQIRGLLQKVHADMIAGPSALGIYRLRLEQLDKDQKQQIQQRIAELAARSNVVTYVAEEKE